MNVFFRQYRVVLIGLSIILVIFQLLTPLYAASSGIEKLKFSAQKYYWGKGVQQNQAKALELYLRAAELGDTESKYIAGGMYYKGIGTTRDLEKAFSLLYGSALQGNSTLESQRILGQFFLTGKTVPKNYAEAMKWYKKAAENGDSESQSELAFLYFTGRGGEKDLAKAYYWYKQSALQGQAVAQYSLGIMYFSGSGVQEPNLIKSYGWFSLAAAQNHQDGVVARDYLETVLSTEELNQAQRFSVELYRDINDKTAR